MTGLTPIPWEGTTENNSDNTSDQKLKADLEAFLERTENTGTIWENGLWSLMAMLARRDQMDAQTLKRIRLSFQELAEAANKLAQKKLDE